MCIRSWGIILSVLSLASIPRAQADPSLSIYLSSPGTQSTFITSTGVETENFDSLPTGIDTTPDTTSNIGTYNFGSSTPGAIVVADQYGGAGDTGKYLAVGSQSKSAGAVTISLIGNENYFGFWFSAGDSYNNISFYSGSTLLAKYNVQSILTLLSNPTVTAIDNQTYQSSSYFGNPNMTGNNRNNSQPYSYVDIFGNNGTTFNKIVIDNSGSQNTGFESDNHSIYSGTITTPGGDVFVATVPEPSQYVALLGGVLFCLVAGQRLLKKLRLNFDPALAVAR